MVSVLPCWWCSCFIFSMDSIWTADTRNRRYPSKIKPSKPLLRLCSSKFRFTGNMLNELLKRRTIQIHILWTEKNQKTLFLTDFRSILVSLWRFKSLLNLWRIAAVFDRSRSYDTRIVWCTICHFVFHLRQFVALCVQIDCHILWQLFPRICAQHTLLCLSIQYYVVQITFDCVRVHFVSIHMHSLIHNHHIVYGNGFGHQFRCLSTCQKNGSSEV